MAIVCHCYAVRERTLQKVIRRGAVTLEAVQAECGATSRCGGCEPVVREMLDEAHATGFAYESVVAVAL